MQEESCGKCPPCRIGTKRMLEILERICAGKGEMEDIDKLIKRGNSIADLTIMEEGAELLVRLKDALVEKKEVSLPMFTNCSPGWIKFAEHYFPDLLDHLSSCKSPQQMFGTVAKT